MITPLLDRYRRAKVQPADPGWRTGREGICFCLCLPADVAWGVEHLPHWHVREVSGLLCRLGRGPGGVTGVEEEDREGRSKSDSRSESDKQVQPVGPGWRP
eukprot:1293667-Rhodomonas_salina.1